MNRFIFWQRWLLTISILIVVFGLALAVASGTSAIDPLNRMVDPVFWGGQPVPPQAAAFRGWTYAVMGAAMAGWGVFLAFVAGIPFRRRERWAWNCMVLGILFWYVPDTGFSLQAGVMFNAAVNTVLLALFALPLFFTRREFASDTERNRG
ncbi:MAG: hypothetical protein ACK2UB_06050 [Anaerolineales bacterium]